jgi:hypothetical protein
MKLLLPVPKPGVKVLYLMKILRNEWAYYQAMDAAGQAHVNSDVRLGKTKHYAFDDFTRAWPKRKV